MIGSSLSIYLSIYLSIDLLLRRLIISSLMDPPWSWTDLERRAFNFSGTLRTKVSCLFWLLWVSCGSMRSGCKLKSTFYWLWHHISWFFVDFGWPLGSSGTSFGSLQAPSGRHGRHFLFVGSTLDGSGPTFGWHFSKSSIFLILISLYSGIGGFRGLAIQVGATWSRSEPTQRQTSKLSI